MIIQEQQKVAILGGSFDPFHNGHLILVNNLLSSRVVEQVWLTPTGNRNDKQYQSSTEHRLHMLNKFYESLSDADKQFISICTVQIEGQSDGVSTMRLMETLSQQHPQLSFYFVIGADLVDDLKNWVDSERLLKEVQFIVFPRELDNQDQHSNLTCNATYLPTTNLISSSISSTAIRRNIKDGLPILGLVPSCIAEHIYAHGLYKS